MSNMTGIGASASWNNSSATDNTGAGYQVLYHNFGNNNTATGSGALYSNTNGASNTGDGLNSLYANTTGYHNSAVGATSYGLIAEEVARVYPELVLRNDAGRIEGVRSDELAPMLLNELQQEHQRLESVQGQLADLTARLAELERVKARVGSR